MILTIAVLVLGLILLVAGGEVLVRGGSGLGRALGLSPLVVGLTVVAFATSAPELAVSVDATFSGAPGLAVGNVVGSNISNILLVLGLAALVLPVAVRSQLLRIDVPVMIIFSVLALVLALNGLVGRVEGVLLLALLVVYLGWSIRSARRATTREVPTGVEAVTRAHPVRDVVLVVAGIALLVLGARFLVDAATQIAQAAGLSDLVIGLTIVSIGTSLPEVATSLIAAMRGQRELAIGNVVGSNIFNIGAVLGITALIAPDGVRSRPPQSASTCPSWSSSASPCCRWSSPRPASPVWKQRPSWPTTPPTSPTCCWTQPSTTLCPSSAPCCCGSWCQ